MKFESYIAKSKNFENTHTSQEKKEQGIYYTDINLACLIINFLKIPFDSIIMDPCCGCGNFIAAAESSWLL